MLSPCTKLKRSQGEAGSGLRARGEGQAGLEYQLEGTEILLTSSTLGSELGPTGKGGPGSSRFLFAPLSSRRNLVKDRL